MTGYAVVGCPENPHISGLTYTAYFGQQDSVYLSGIFFQRFNRLIYFFCQFSIWEFFFIFNSLNRRLCRCRGKTNPLYVRIVYISEKSQAIERKGSFTCGFKLKVTIEQSLRSCPAGIEKVFFKKLTHPDIRKKKSNA